MRLAVLRWWCSWGDGGVSGAVAQAEMGGEGRQQRGGIVRPEQARGADARDEPRRIGQGRAGEGQAPRVLAGTSST